MQSRAILKACSGLFHRLHGDDLRWRGICGIDQANAHLLGLPWLKHQLSQGRPLLPLAQHQVLGLASLRNTLWILQTRGLHRPAEHHRTVEVIAEAQQGGGAVAFDGRIQRQLQRYRS